MNQLDVWLDDDSLGPPTQVGSLFRVTSRSGDTLRFEYDAGWLTGAGKVTPFEIDPELSLHSGPMHTAAGAGKLHRILRDTSPDRWGRVLMERREAMEAGDERRKPRNLREWDFLTGVNDDTRMGALRLFDPAALDYVDNRDLGAPPFARLRELEEIASKLDEVGVEDRPEYRQWLRQLVLPGTSLGGARPKASFQDEEGRMWLAKFPASDDRRDVGLWEYLACQLALRAGVRMPISQRLSFSGRGHTFAVRRFDRENGSRRMYSSAMTLLGKNDGESASYLDIVQALEIHGDPTALANDLEQLYRRILFSILVGNRDDHLRNHGFLRAPGGWRLSPAFDINPNPDKDVHALAIDEADPRPSSDLLRATAAFYRLSAAQVTSIETQVRDAVQNWQDDARALGLPGREIDAISAVIDPQR